MTVSLIESPLKAVSSTIITTCLFWVWECLLSAEAVADVVVDRVTIFVFGFVNIFLFQFSFLCCFFLFFYFNQIQIKQLILGLIIIINVLIYGCNKF